MKACRGLLVGWWNFGNRWIEQVLQAIGLWSQSNIGLIGSDQLLKRKITRQGSKTKGKCQVQRDEMVLTREKRQ